MTDPDGVTNRICPACGRPVAVDPRYGEMAVSCPGCGAVVPSALAAAGASGPGASAPAEGRKRGRLDPVAGWGVSLAVHAVLLLLFLQITWLVGLGQGIQDAEVGIIGEDSGPTIEKGSASLTAGEVHTPDLAALSVDTAVTTDPIDSLASVSAVTAPAGATRMDAIIGVVGGGEAAGDWSGVALGGGGGGGGGEFFGLQAKGSKFVYVIDHSGSMTGAKVQAAKDELLRSLGALRRNSKFFVIFYNNTFDPMPATDLVPASDENKRTYGAWIQAMPAGGGTDPTGAMQHALGLKPDAIWLLSDGLFGERAADVIRSANPGAKVQIHTIAFYENTGEAVLQRIAEENRGKYRFVPPGALGLPAPGAPVLPMPIAPVRPSR